jgi:hypothetical protein
MAGSVRGTSLAVCVGVVLGVCELFGVEVLGDRVWAAAPQLNLITPRGVQRGVETEVTFHGARLEDVQQVLSYQAGLEPIDLQLVNPQQVKVKLKVAADCPLGTKHLRLRAASGLSDMRTLRVGALPVVAEAEPNSEFSTPQAVPFNVTVEGSVANEDVDYYVVEAKQGDRITAEVEAIRLGDSLFDVYVAILNEARFELSTSDDAALVYQDGIASVIAPADGKYFVQIRESSFGAGNYYRCHIGSYPRPFAVVPAGGRPGSTVQLKFFGDVAGALTKDVTLPSSIEHEFAVFAEDEKGISPSGLKFRLSDLDNVIEVEPNDAAAQATAATTNSIAFNGLIGAPGDVDHFAFTATKGQVFDIQVYARRLRSELDSLLYVHNAAGGILAGNDDTGGPDSFQRFAVPEDGTFLVSVRDHLLRGGDGFHYRIELAPVTPQLDLSVNEFVQYVEPKLAVPQGNRFPVLINASRRDFGGPLEFLGENLPAGVTIESYALAPDLAVAQVLLVAAADAPLATNLSQIVGRLADPNQPSLVVTGKTRQDCIMVRGQNQIPFFVETLPALPVTVTQSVPFTLQVVEPKAPLVQNGTMRLKVVATRAEGFTAPIKVELLLNPPGVNSSREASIAEGQTETFIDINAAGNAQVKEHLIAVRGDATVGNGPVTVSTPFAKLRVAEPYVKLTFEQAAVEQGQQTELAVAVETATPFEGTAQVTLYGLPNKVTTTPLDLTKDVKELVFPVKAEADAPPGTNKSLFCQVVVMEQGEPVVHNIGSGTIRIDQPLPPKANPPPMPVVQAPPPEPKPDQPPPKRLTRLEQLRLEAKQRLEAAQSGSGSN